MCFYNVDEPTPQSEMQSVYSFLPELSLLRLEEVKLRAKPPTQNQTFGHFGQTFFLLRPRLRRCNLSLPPSVLLWDVGLGWVGSGLGLNQKAVKATAAALMVTCTLRGVLLRAAELILTTCSCRLMFCRNLPASNNYFKTYHTRFVKTE